jgi:hypothetical protein
MSHLSKRWNSSSSTEWQPASLLVLGDLSPHSAQRPSTPTVNAGKPCAPTKEWELQPPH